MSKKHTYQLRFGTGSYAELLPSTRITLSGGWIDGTKIWRESMPEVKIGRLDNPTIYDTLESWFTDDTKFETTINIKILKSGVEQSVHWFGVKWGAINQNEKTYSVIPIVYDLWSQYFESTRDIKYQSAISEVLKNWDYYGDSSTYPYEQGFLFDASLERVIKILSSIKSGWTDTDVISSFLFDDNYEDTSVVGTYQGMSLDYVTGEQSFLTNSGMIVKGGKSFSDLLSWLTVYRVFVYFDSNDKLRYEHIKFFNDKLTDNAVDYSSYIKSYDEKFSYQDTSIPVLENLRLRSDEDSIGLDFQPLDIIYSDARNRPDVQNVEYGWELYSDVGVKSTSTARQDDLTIFSGLSNAVYKWFDISMLSFASDFNSFNIEWNHNINEDECGSNDIKITIAEDYDFTAQISSLNGTFDVYLQDRSAGTLASNKITISSTGVSTGVIAPLFSTNDGFLKIEGISGITGTAEGWITLINTSALTVPTIDGIVTTNPQTNGSFSVANIIDNWWRDDRLSRQGEFNSTAYTFDGTEYNLQRDDIRIYLATTPNPLFGFNDGTRIGKIESWEHDLDTDFYSISLTYQEDD